MFIFPISRDINPAPKTGVTALKSNFYIKAIFHIFAANSSAHHQDNRQIYIHLEKTPMQPIYTPWWKNLEVHPDVEKFNMLVKNYVNNVHAFKSIFKLTFNQSTTESFLNKIKNNGLTKIEI